MSWTDTSKITKKEIEDLLAGTDKTPFAIVDVREDHEVAEGMIPSAKHIRLDDILPALQLNEEDFVTKYGYPKFKRDETIIFYCRVGKRSAVAQYIAKKMGYKHVRNYVGSWLEWNAENEGKAI